MVFDLWLQPTCDPIIAALDERPDHLFQRVLHVGGITNSTAVFNPLHQDGTARFDLLMTSGRLEPFGTLVTSTPPTMLTRTNTAPLPASTAPDHVPAVYTENCLVLAFIGVMDHGHLIRSYGVADTVLVA